MSTNKTNYLNLHRWEGADPVLRNEFNENFSAIDGAIGGAVKVLAGTYTGDGTVDRLIALPFTPKAVLVISDSSVNYPALVLPGHPIQHIHNSDVDVMVRLAEDGFVVGYHTYSPAIGQTNVTPPLVNAAGVKCRYLAFG